MSKPKESPTNSIKKEGISILIPSYDEVLTIKETIDSILNSRRDFPIEIIVIDDGKESDTLDYLKSIYSFKLVDHFKEKIDDNTIRHIYKTINKDDIYVIDKENEGKSKALNTAIKLCNYKYFVSIDGDTLIDENCLINFYAEIDENTIAIGGRIVPIKNEDSLIGKLLFFYQRWEYFRNFSYSRISFNNINCVPLLSGALSLFSKEAVINVGFYNNKTVGEDFDLTIKLHEYSFIYGGTIKYSSKAIAYTQVPFDLISFYKQRLRWQIGLLEVLKLHKNNLPRTILISLILKLINFYESYSVFLEIIFILINRNTSLYLLLTLSLLSTIQLIVLKIINKENDDTNYLLLLALQLLIHIFYTAIRLIALLKVYFIGKNYTWGRVKRKTNSK